MRDNYTPLLRICAWAALVFGFICFFAVFLVTVQVPDLPGQMFSIKTLGFFFAIGSLLVWVLVFALLQAVASITDAVEEIRSEVKDKTSVISSA